MVKNIFFSLIVLFFLFYSPASAQNSPANPSSGQMRQQIEKQREKQLEVLKNSNPELYKRALRAMDRQKKIDEIVQDFYQKELDEDTAQRRLYPLIQEDMNDFLQYQQPQMLEMLKKQIQQLEEARKDPQALIQRRIDQYLGRGQPASPPSPQR